MKLQGYLDKLIALSHTDEMVEVVKEMSVKEQFINSCPRDVAAHLRESVSTDLKELATTAECYLIAYNKLFLVTQPTGKISQADDVVPVMRGKDLGQDSP